ncbi:hypothetical protein, partial [Amycolatopsis palatopharyngis]|uniref:hypothetical protein n=1 Tax=Amycolatopsis palatopharyngis TaxID=187982 RepID=UPI001B868924
MNPEVESLRLMITQTGKHAQVQGATSPRYVHNGRENSRVVAQDPAAPPPETALATAAHGIGGCQ